MSSDWFTDRDNEEHPRNAGAIRTAIMLGAVLVHNEHTGKWKVEGIDVWCTTKTMPAWFFLATHGLGIDKDGSPCAIGVVRAGE
jgi:hypothetical protein